MVIAYVVVTVATIVVNAGAATADFLQVKYVLGNASELGLPASWVFPLGMLKAAGAVGLLVGLFGGWPIGIAAAVGLVLFFAGAVAIHVRKGVFHNITAPITCLALAIASLALALAR